MYIFNYMQVVEDNQLNTSFDDFSTFFYKSLANKCS